MKLLLDHQRKELLANGQANLLLRDNGLAEDDFNPVVKLFSPWGAATWLLTELNPEDPDIAFGLCDLGMGCPELGNVSLGELESVTGPAVSPSNATFTSRPTSHGIKADPCTRKERGILSAVA